MESFAKELVPNASAQLFSDNALNAFTNFLPVQLNLKVNGRLPIQEYPNHECTKMSLSENLCFPTKKLSNSSEFYYLEPGLYPSTTEIVGAMNTLIQKRHNHNEKCITVKVSRRTQKIETYLSNEGSGLALFRTDLGHIFGSNVGN